MAAGVGSDPAGAQVGVEPRAAVEEPLETLHEDYAYEFQIGWNLWENSEVSREGLDPPLGARDAPGARDWIRAAVR